MNYFLNKFIWPIEVIRTGTITPDSSGPGSNNNEWVLHTSQNFKTEASLSDVVDFHTVNSSFF